MRTRDPAVGRWRRLYYSGSHNQLNVDDDRPTTSQRPSAGADASCRPSRSKRCKVPYLGRSRDEETVFRTVQTTLPASSVRSPVAPPTVTLREGLVVPEALQTWVCPSSRSVQPPRLHAD